MKLIFLIFLFSASILNCMQQRQPKNDLPFYEGEIKEDFIGKYFILDGVKQYLLSELSDKPRRFPRNGCHWELGGGLSGDAITDNESTKAPGS